MSRLWATFLTTSPLFKLGFVVVVVAVLALVSGSVGGFVSHLKDKAFDKQITALKAERDKLKQQADEAEAHAKALESEKTKYLIAIELAGARADAALERVNAAEKEFNQEVSNIGVDIDAVERCLRLCTKLKLKPEQCGCTKEGSSN